ncbi:S-adenosyl-L-methionine-dependent methyltransferase [Conidiobolus coronatus NRRL 28638]|uniref:S-adenosyl-L-methionine-dependent methyltransferase n=1 Tax=Conidiobolus coronatus (strain ATCC 28846 / CBS 209.66 / NRRL 28638) TaxID=796925 RepID=A0A137PD83_CONC2|nr:S-adenosyl-L-methionine-dependent methyltransferase [Conidiobolus coronatus NRRL 28638]|eukprot:KXN72957.1 S-adenosyl-L-methionine-dependent methyltransferase [Conidiobolus coronatus NRRL 28638]
MDLSFEIAQTLNYIFDNSKEGNAASVLKAFDEIGDKLWIMTVGDNKGKMVVDQLTKHNPKIGVELGTYIGYSAVMFDPIMVSVAAKVVEFSGLRDYVTILRGDLAKNIPILKQKYKVENADFMFIDQMKDLYTSDFVLAEQSGLFNKDTLIVADNIKSPGAPEFLAFMEQNNKYKFELKDAKSVTFDIELLMQS